MEYLALLGVAAWAAFPRSLRPNISFIQGKVSVISNIVLILFAVDFSLRQNRLVPDRAIYVHEFKKVSETPWQQLLGTTFDTASEPLYILVLKIISLIGVSEVVLYTSITILMALITLSAIKMLINPVFSLPVFFCTIALGVFTAYSSVAIRQGLAMSLLLLAFALYVKTSNRFLFFLTLAFAATLHWSSIPLVVILSLVVTLKVRLKEIVCIWAFGVLLYVTGLNRVLFGKFLELVPLASGYIDDSLANGYAGGTNRLDFLVVAVFFGLLAIVLRKNFLGDKSYEKLIVLYFAMSIYFLLFGFIYFSDRLAAYSWYFVPIICLYPILRSPREITKPLLALGVLFFLVYGSVLGPFRILLF